MTATPRRTTAPGSSSSAVQTPVSANASTALGTATTPGTATNLGTATPPGDAIPLIHRRHEPGYPVPKSFGKACLAFFDVRFRVFVTPWIITILWSLAILGLLIGVATLGYETFLQEETASAEPLAAEESQGRWEFEPLADQPFLKTKLVHFFWQASLLCIGLLVVRVLCEAAVVLLRAATDLHEWKSQTKP